MFDQYPLRVWGGGLGPKGVGMITDLMDMLFGCWHTRYSFPITAKPGYRSKAAQATGTYVVCLDCGKEFAYDWAQMKVVPNDFVATEMPAPARLATKQAA